MLAVTDLGGFRAGWLVTNRAQIQLKLSGTNMSAVTFVTFVRLEEVGEAAEFVGGYGSRDLFLGCASASAQNSAPPPTFLNLTNVTNMTALRGDPSARCCRHVRHVRQARGSGRGCGICRRLRISRSIFGMCFSQCSEFRSLPHFSEPDERDERDGASG